jgi:hypothetical protein
MNTFKYDSSLDFEASSALLTDAVLGKIKPAFAHTRKNQTFKDLLFYTSSMNTKKLRKNK